MTAAAEQDEAPPRLRILWTTMGPFPQPLVGITVQGEFMDTERAELLELVAEFVTAGRKRRGDEVESTIRGSNVEDYVQIKAAAVEAVSLLATEHLNLQRELAAARMTNQCLAYPGRDAEGNLSPDREPACTGITASWCPRCGDCKCPPLRKEVSDMDAPGCPLHALDSVHGEDPEVGALQEEAAREAAAQKVRTP